MGRFNLNDYEEVKDRIPKFYKEFPDGRIITKCLVANGKVAKFKTYLYKDRDDQRENLPFSTGYAYEERVEELKTNKDGRQYAEVNYSSWVENCETSSIGRALANANYSGEKRPSKEEMQKVEKMGVVKDVVEEAVKRGDTCKKCGAEMKMSRAGKLYCSALCWKDGN